MCDPPLRSPALLLIPRSLSLEYKSSEITLLGFLFCFFVCFLFVLFVCLFVFFFLLCFVLFFFSYMTGNPMATHGALLCVGSTV